MLKCNPVTNDTMRLPCKRPGENLLFSVKSDTTTGNQKKEHFRIHFVIPCSFYCDGSNLPGAPLTKGKIGQLGAIDPQPVTN